MSRIADRVAVAVGDDQVVELARPCCSRPERAQDQLARALVDPAAGHFEVLPHQRRPDVVDREVVAGQLVGVDDDVHRPDPAADEVDRADAGDRLEPLLDLLAGDLGHLAEVAAAGDGDRHHRHRRRCRTCR